MTNLFGEIDSLGIEVNIEEFIDRDPPLRAAAARAAHSP